MRFRCGFAVKTVEELTEKLGQCSSFAAANKPGKGIYYGQQEAGAHFTNASLKLIENGNLEEFAEYWVRGADVDWDALYPKNKPCRISLPTYPFLKQRYWIAESPGLPPLSRLTELMSENAPPEISGYSKNTSPNISPFLLELAEATEKERIEMIAGFLQKKVGDLLGFAPDNLPAQDQGFFALGMESMQVLALQTDLKEIFKVNISDTASFDYPDIKTFSLYLRDLIPYDELEPDDEPDDKKLPDEGRSGLMHETAEPFMAYLYQEPLPDEIMAMDIEKVEKSLMAEIEIYSERIPH
jgi:acyl carrier protein